MKMNLKTNFGIAVAGLILVAGGPGAVADEPAPAPARDAVATISSLSGSLVDADGKALAVGSQIKPGSAVKSADGKDVRVVLSQGGVSSSLIRITGGSEVEFVKLTASADADYPLLDAEVALRSDRVRSAAKRIY